MKIILSRKGFDSSYGKCASPILPDGTMISMPIPSDDGNCKFDELAFPGGKSYAEIWRELKPRGNHAERCHLDPDIRAGVRAATPDGWLPAFGQIDAAQSHLRNQGIKEGDLFLFFGWFRQTEYIDGKLSFVKDAPDIHAIYGYMQIGAIAQKFDVRNYPWHPHSDDVHVYKNGKSTNNTIYLASDRLVIDGEDAGLPGAGVFPYAKKRVLTRDGAKGRTEWALSEVLGKVPLTYHSEGNVHDGFFQSASRGQEFVFAEDARVTEWAKSII